MTERLIAKLDRLGAEAGIDTMTPEIRQFALLVRKDLVAQWPQRPWVGLTDDELGECMVLKQFVFDPPYIDKSGKEWTGNLEIYLRGTYENINNKLMDNNT